MALAEVAGDLRLADDGRSFIWADGPARLQQRIALEFLIPLGSCRYDTTIGFDWPGLLSRKATPAERRAAVRTKLLTFPEVVSVVRLNETLDKAARAAVYEYLARINTGETISGSIAFPLAEAT